MKSDLEGGLSKPKSAIGMIVAGLRKRRDTGVKSFTVLSCDNLPENGDKVNKRSGGSFDRLILRASSGFSRVDDRGLRSEDIDVSWAVLGHEVHAESWRASANQKSNPIFSLASIVMYKCVWCAELIQFRKVRYFRALSIYHVLFFLPSANKAHNRFGTLISVSRVVKQYASQRCRWIKIFPCVLLHVHHASAPFLLLITSCLDQTRRAANGRAR